MIDVVGTLKRGARGLIAHIDFPLLLITLTIMAVGLATVHSATYGGNERMLSQAGNMGVALVIMWFVARLPPQKLMGFAIPLYIVGLLLLVAGPDVVRIAPSLVISLDEMLEGLARLEQALNHALK